MGILDTIKIRKDSYPVRRLYKIFYRRYEELHPESKKYSFEKHVSLGSDFVKLSKELIKESAPHLGTSVLLFGTTKVFMRVEAVAELEELRKKKLIRKERTARSF